MTSRDFCYWLQGCLELANAQDGSTLRAVRTGQTSLFGVERP